MSKEYMSALIPQLLSPEFLEIEKFISTINSIKKIDKDPLYLHEKQNKKTVT